MKPKTILAVSIAACLVASASWLNYARTLNRNRDAFVALGEANNERLKAGPGIESAEAFVAALRKIDVSHTSRRFQEAFRLYVEGLAEGISRLKAGKVLGDSDTNTKTGYSELLAISRQSGFEWLSSFDVPMAVMCTLSGCIFLSSRKQQAAARLERVRRGEMTEDLAKRRNRDLTLSGYTLVFAGLGIAVSHFLSS
ncbi:MAG TPA: hypothetical protein VNW30_08140 [Opitutaceae bacterium]|nr:hypothetical protein [Opitutaceae bacterium]